MAEAAGADTGREHRLEALSCAKRVRAMLGGVTVLDTQDAVVLRETGRIALYHMPRADVAMELLTPTGHVSRCPHKGEARHYTIAAGGLVAENAAWSHEGPVPACPALSGRLAFHWKQLDSWWEEDEEVFVHARDPHVRIDILESRRPVEVIVGGVTVARTTRARFLFETGHVTRYYIPPEDVAADVLRPSASHTGCPYKGTASYHHLEAGGRRIEDAVWFYPEPLDEVRRIGSHLCFYPEKVDAILVDGKPAT